MSKKTVKSLAAFILAFLLLAAHGCGAPSVRKQTATWFDCFDTVITLTAYTNDDALFKKAAGEAEGIFRRCHKLFDIYNEYEGVNGLAAVNRLAGSPVHTEPEVIELIQLCMELEGQTHGSMNIALGPVLRIWHDQRTAAENGEGAALPDEALLRKAAKLCKIANVRVDAEAGTVTLIEKGMSLDVGAVAKGYAADKAASALKAYGFPFLLNCGGAVLTYGEKPGGEEWKAGVADPNGGEGFAFTVNVVNGALSTSGAYLRSFTVNGAEYGHIIDPETLFPANLSNGAPGERVASVSVKVSGDNCAAKADALSTACFILGVEGGSRLVSEAGAEAVFVLENGRIERFGGQ